jgi:hypothetical protein
MMIFADFRRIIDTDILDVSTVGNGVGVREEFRLDSGVMEVISDFRMSSDIGVFFFLEGLEGVIGRFLMGLMIDSKRMIISEG